VEKEKTELATNLKRFLRDAWLPAETALSNDTIGLTDMRSASDYLLLDYTTPQGQRARIQDGLQTGILVEVENQRPLSEIADLVESTASAVLRIPESAKPEVFVSIMDIGQSKIGSLYCGNTTDATQFDWWTNVRWWSDGKKVLFVITKLTNDDYRRLATRCSLEIAPEPRVFASRSK
jgi:hypothetical protein